MQTIHVPPAVNGRTGARARLRGEAGFSMAEVLIATTLTLMVSGAATQALMQMSRAQKGLWNRAEMHAAVRSATELLQQEVGQAGRVSLPADVTTTGSVAAGGRTLNVSSTAGMFPGEVLTIGAGSLRETAVVAGIAGSTLTLDNAGMGSGSGVFLAHTPGEPVAVLGGFATGIVPPSMPSGSTGDTLKLFGDVNGDGHMVYVEYLCDGARGKLLRMVTVWGAASKTPASDAGVLLSNLMPNPDGTPCFVYQSQAVGAQTFVTSVAITLTAQTQQRDPVTHQFQTERKALLNISPRNVFEVWELASQGVSDRVQPMPPAIAALLP